jgi:hypothetical protein
MGVQEAAVGVAQARLRLLGFVHKLIRNKGEPSLTGQRTTPSAHASARLAAMWSAVSSGQIASTSNATAPPGSSSPKSNAFTEPRPSSSCNPLRMQCTVHLKASRRRPGVAIVVTVGEQHVLGWLALLEPLQSLGRDHRVDDHALGEQVVGADIHVDLVVPCRPVPQSGRDLLHGAQRNAS